MHSEGYMQYLVSVCVYACELVPIYCAESLHFSAFLLLQMTDT